METGIAQQKNFLKEWKISSGNLKNIKSIPDVFKEKTPVLSVIKKEYGMDFMLTYLAMWISWINKFCDGRMDENDCLNASQLIFDDFYFLTIADLKLIFGRLKKRKFIRVSGNEIYNEINAYFNERCEHAQIYSDREAQLHKKNVVKSELNNDQVIKLYKSVRMGEKLSGPMTKEKRICYKIREENKKAAEYYRNYRKENPNPAK